ncbi:MAG: protein translocase subunit SecF [Gemmatimonadota bacterium]
MRIFADASFKFIELRKKAYVFSAVVVLAGIAGMAVNFATMGSWLNYGVDFTGGSLVQLRFEGEVTAGDLRAALGGAEAPPITRFGEDHEFVIRAPIAEEASIEEVAGDIETQVRAALPDEAFTVVRTELVGAKVGNELQQKAALAILFSFVTTLIYLAFRFEFRFGSAAVIATMHDVLVTLGFLALFRVEISLTTVAALLTIVGYSLNDTIVVFDRIRENMAKKGARKRDPVEVVNESINETLPRTFLTSGTTLAVLFCLLLLGGPVIRDFTLVLILGVVVGTYSSIFVASPALIEIQQRWGMGTASDEKKKRPQPATV